MSSIFTCQISAFRPPIAVSLCPGRQILGIQEFLDFILGVPARFDLFLIRGARGKFAFSSADNATASLIGDAYAGIAHRKDFLNGNKLKSCLFPKLSCSCNLSCLASVYKACREIVGKVAYRILEEEELAKIAALSEEERNAVDPGTARKEEISLMAAQLEEDDVPVMEDAGNEKEE